MINLTSIDGINFKLSSIHHTPPLAASIYFELSSVFQKYHRRNQDKFKQYFNTKCYQ